MAVMNVNPTRMQLTDLKKKLITARRGHKLLKDKRDELMRQFLELVRENKTLRKKVEEAIKRANTHINAAILPNSTRLHITIPSIYNPYRVSPPAGKTPHSMV